MQHQHSLSRQGWNTSPAEVNHRSSSKASLLVNNKSTDLLQLLFFNTFQTVCHATIF